MNPKMKSFEKKSPKNRRLSRQLTVDEANLEEIGFSGSLKKAAKSPIPNFEEISNPTILAAQHSIELELDSQNNSPR